MDAAARYRVIRKLVLAAKEIAEEGGWQLTATIFGGSDAISACAAAGGESGTNPNILDGRPGQTFLVARQEEITVLGPYVRDDAAPEVG